MSISIKPRETSILPAGSYYVGDLCYLFDEKTDDIYQAYVCGVNMDDEGKPVNIKAGRRKEFAAFYGSTAYGDGQFTDNLGNEYSVDAGILGVVQLLSSDLIAEAKKIEAEGHGKIIEFKENFSVDRDEAGTFTFGHLTIVTNDDEDEYDPYDEDDDGLYSDGRYRDDDDSEEEEYNNHY